MLALTATDVGLGNVTNAAQVTSVTGTYPIVSTGGATPDISIAFGTSTSNTWAGTQTFQNPVSIGTLSGLVGANSGLTYSVSTSTLNIGGTAGNVTGIVSIANGGTNASSWTGNSLLYSNSDSTALAFAATSSLNIGGNAGTATALETARTINGTPFNGTADITITAASSTLLANDNTWSGTNTFTNTITGSVSGNAGTVTNGIYTTDTGTVTDTMLAGSIDGTKLLDAAVTYAKIQNLNYGDIIGRNTAGAGVSTGLSTSTYKSMLALTATDVGLGNVTNAAQVTSVTGTYPIVSSGGATPDISIAFSTSTDNTWGGTQTFQNPVSIGTLSGLISGNSGALYSTATSTISFGYASTTQIGSTGSAYFATSGGSVGIASTSPSTTFSVNGSGYFTCGTVPASGASSAGGWTSRPPDIVRLGTTTDLVGVGVPSPTAKLDVNSGGPATTTLALHAVTSQIANILEVYDNTLALSSVIAPSGYFGIGTTSPLSLLSVGTAGNAFRVDTAGAVKEGIWNGSAIGALYGGTGEDSSAWNGLAGVSNGVWYQVASSSIFGFTPASNAITLSTTYPLQGGGDLTTDRTFSLAFGTSTDNTWGGTQTFQNPASHHAPPPLLRPGG